MSDLEECPHGMGNPEWCAECKITNAPIVYTTGGGTRYHSTGKCPALIEGQKKVGTPEPIKPVKLGSIDTEGRSPCKTCDPQKG